MNKFAQSTHEAHLNCRHSLALLEGHVREGSAGWRYECCLRVHIFLLVFNSCVNNIELGNRNSPVFPSRSQRTCCHFMLFHRSKLSSKALYSLALNPVTFSSFNCLPRFCLSLLFLSFGWPGALNRAMPYGTPFHLSAVLLKISWSRLPYEHVLTLIAVLECKTCPACFSIKGNWTFKWNVVLQIALPDFTGFVAVCQNCWEFANPSDLAMVVREKNWSITWN